MYEVTSTYLGPLSQDCRVFLAGMVICLDFRADLFGIKADGQFGISNAVRTALQSNNFFLMFFKWLVHIQQ